MYQGCTVPGSRDEPTAVVPNIFFVCTRYLAYVRTGKYLTAQGEKSTGKSTTDEPSESRANLPIEMEEEWKGGDVTLSTQNNQAHHLNRHDHNQSISSL